jgi:aryl-alcohol dehydrogenase-like predicted oxidoreductase
MKYRKLGSRTDLTLSEVGLGAWGIGGAVAVTGRTQPGFAPANYGDVSEEQAIATIQATLDAGITFIDTAPFYGGDGVSELRIGKALRARADKPVVLTKVGVFKDGDAYRRVFTREVVERQVEESRQRLGMDVLDIELIHSPNRAEYGDGQSLEAILEAKAAGKVRYIGFSLGTDPEIGIEWIETGLIDVVELPLNLLRPEMEQVLPVAAKHGVGVIAREPLANGFLTGRFNRDTAFPATDQRSNLSRQRVLENLDRFDQLRFLSQSTGRTASQAALLWVLSHPEVTSVIAGAMTPGEATENAAVADLSPLTDAELARVREIHDRGFKVEALR